MADERMLKLAKVLVQYCTEVAPGELCSIEGESAAEPLIEAIYEEVLRAGAHPVVMMTPQRAQAALFELASDAQLDRPSPLALSLAETADARIRVLASTNTRELSQVAPERQVRRQRALEPVMERIMARSAAGELRWVGCLFPTDGQASEAEMSLSAYEDFVYSACLCDRDDPVAAWHEQAGETRRLAALVQGREELHLLGEGTDLRLSVAGRTFVAGDGRRNMPCGEFFTGPVEDSAEGEVSFSVPATFAGREVSGVRLRFHEGLVVDASAERGEELLLQMLDSDAGARRLGEVGIGTNFQITRGTRSILFDEKIGGTVHLALGRSYPETGGLNISSLHWDLICDLRRGGTLTADGETIQRDGAFVV